MWLLTGDHGGFVKYWQSNMNNVKMYEAHKEPIRGLRWASLSSNSCRQKTVWISLLVAIVSLVYLKLIIIRVFENIFTRLSISLVQMSVQEFCQTLVYFLFFSEVGHLLILFKNHE